MEMTAVATNRLATAAGSLAMLVGCSVIGASQVTLTARNDSEGQMVVQVISGHSGPHWEAPARWAEVGS